MAPHASGQQRGKGSRILSAPNLHQTAPNPSLSGQPKRTLDEFFLDPMIWRAAGLRQLIKMDTPCHNHSLAWPDQRPPRIGWFPGESAPAQPTTLPSTNYGRGSDRQHSQSLSSHQVLTDLPPTFTQPTQHPTHYARQSSRVGQQVPLPPLASSLPSVPSAGLPLAPPPPLPTWERPELSALLQATQRRPRSNKARLRCAKEQLALRVAWLLQAMPVPAPPQLAPPPPPPPLAPGMSPLELAFLSKMLPTVAHLDHAHALSASAHQSHHQHQPLLLPPTPLEHTLLAAIATTSLQHRASISGNPDHLHAAMCQQQQQGLLSHVITPGMLTVPSNQVLGSPTSASAPNRVPVIVLPADGHLQHVPAVCVSSPPAPDSTGTAQGQQQQAWDEHAPTPHLQVSSSGAMYAMATTPAAGVVQQHPQTVTSSSGSPAEEAQGQHEQQQQAGQAESSPTQSATSQHHAVLDSPHSSTEQHPHSPQQQDEGSPPQQEGSGEPMDCPSSQQAHVQEACHSTDAERPAESLMRAAPCGGAEEQPAVTDCDMQACRMGSDAGADQEPVPLSVCPPTNSDASSQHGFTPQGSCGSMAVTDEDVVMHGAVRAADSSDTQERCGKGRQGQQQVLAGSMGEVTMVVSAADKSRGKAAATAPHSPDSPLSDVDMMPA